MSRSPDSFRVGDVFIAGSYVVTPTEVADHHRSRQLAEVLDQPGDVGMRMAPVPAPGGPCPPALLVSGALGRLRSIDAFQALRPHFQSPTRFKTLAEPVVGEPVSCVATVRYRSRNEDGSAFLTLGVELRRRRGGTVASFEIGVELGDDAVEHAVESGRREAGRAA